MVGYSFEELIGFLPLYKIITKKTVLLKSNQQHIQGQRIEHRLSFRFLRPKEILSYISCEKVIRTNILFFEAHGTDPEVDVLDHEKVRSG